MSNSTYNIPKSSVFYQQTIKKSRFIVHIEHTPDIESARAFLASIRHKYSDAVHNCWAHVAGDPSDGRVFGFSDDGGPNGTAGKPILNVLMGSGIGEITAVVTRYFGGVKLGTGGLVRAYGGSVSSALDELETAQKITEMIITGVSEYNHQSTIEQILLGYNILNIQKEFSDKITWTIIMDEREVPLVLSEITDKTSGRVKFTVTE